jgi:hypothetical protein
MGPPRLALTRAGAERPTATIYSQDFGLGALPGISALGESTGYPDLAVASAYSPSMADQTVTFEVVGSGCAARVLVAGSIPAASTFYSVVTDG